MGDFSWSVLYGGNFLCGGGDGYFSGGKPFAGFFFVTWEKFNGGRWFWDKEH